MDDSLENEQQTSECCLRGTPLPRAFCMRGRIWVPAMCLTEYLSWHVALVPGKTHNQRLRPTCASHRDVYVWELEDMQRTHVEMSMQLAAEGRRAPGRCQINFARQLGSPEVTSEKLA
jgi:hypothetical protein